jgi:hypothetical protein
MHVLVGMNLGSGQSRERARWSMVQFRRWLCAVRSPMSSFGQTRGVSATSYAAMQVD